MQSRSEILFIYDAKDINPNGDPFENKPRVDDETGLNIVTDSRLKRTIRDYIESYRKMPVFITIVRKEDGNLKSREERLKELEITKTDKEKIFEKFIDLRLFGATIALAKPLASSSSSVTETSEEVTSQSKRRAEKGWSVVKIGPVQFNLGRSLNRVKIETIKGTTVMPSEEGKAQGTFTETNIVHYSLICFHGIVNEFAGQETKLTLEDLDVLYDAIWNGTKNLITRSKVGQEPRLLLSVTYKDKGFHIGDLHKLVSARFSVDELSVREVSQVTLDVSALTSILLANAERIQKIQIKLDPRLIVNPSIEESLRDKIVIETFNF